MGGRSGGTRRSPCGSSRDGVSQALDPVSAAWSKIIAEHKAETEQWQDEPVAGSSLQSTSGQWQGADAAHGHWAARFTEKGTLTANVRIAATRTKNRSRSMFEV